MLFVPASGGAQEQTTDTYRDYHGTVTQLKFVGGTDLFQTTLLELHNDSFFSTRPQFLSIVNPRE